MPSREKLREFVAWCGKHITGDEKGEAQIFLDHLFKAFGYAGGLKEAGATLEMRVSNANGGGMSFADLVWKPVVLTEMKRRGANLQKYYRQVFDCGTRLVPNRPRYVVLCNFDEFHVYDFDTDLDTPKDTLALKDTHAALDAAVLAPWSSAGSGDSATRPDYSTGRASYGFSAKKDWLAQLLALNQQVTVNIENGSTVAAPGVPKHYPDLKKLVTEDCIEAKG